MMRNPLNIAVDYDDTYTANPDLVAAWMYHGIINGCDVRFVTFRPDDNHNDDIEHTCYEMGVKVIYTGGVQKEVHCEAIGWVPDIWIDDAPETIPSKAKLEAMARE